MQTTHAQTVVSCYFNDSWSELSQAELVACKNYVSEFEKNLPAVMVDGINAAIARNVVKRRLIPAVNNSLSAAVLLSSKTNEQVLSVNATSYRIVNAKDNTNGKGATSKRIEIVAA